MKPSCPSCASPAAVENRGRHGAKRFYRCLACVDPETGRPRTFAVASGYPETSPRKRAVNEIQSECMSNERLDRGVFLRLRDGELAELDRLATALDLKRATVARKALLEGARSLMARGIQPEREPAPAPSAPEVRP